jgi:hypothetical protein
MKTANQRYKESGSTMPFKQWLEQEVQQRKEEIMQKSYNATGDSKFDINIFNVSIKWWLLGISLIGVGVYIYKSNKTQQ